MLQNQSMPASTVIPELAYPDIGEAVAWLSYAFGFTVRLRIGNHRAQLNVGDGAIVITEWQGLGESARWTSRTPSSSVSKTWTPITSAPCSTGQESCAHQPTTHTGNANTAPRTSPATVGTSPNQSPMSIRPSGEARRARFHSCGCLHLLDA